MTALRLALACVFAATVVVTATARDDKPKIDKDKLLGTWTYVKQTPGEALPEGVQLKLEFKKDGKVDTSFTANGKTMKESSTYTLKGDQLSIVGKGPDGKEKKKTVTITALTEKKLVSIDVHDGKKVTVEFKK